jgi:hypothetical protein
VVVAGVVPSAVGGADAALLGAGGASPVPGLPGVEAGALVPLSTVVPGGVATSRGLEEAGVVEEDVAGAAGAGAGAGASGVVAVVLGVVGAAVRRSLTWLRVCGALDAVIGSGTA